MLKPKKKVEMMSNILTSASLFNFLCSFCGSAGSLFFFLLSPASVKVFYHHTDKHVEYEEANQQKEGNKVD